MAKRKGRKRTPLVPLKFVVDLPLLTAADNGGVATGTLAALEQGFEVISTDLTAVLRDLSAGEGPIEFGLAAAAYTVAEIIEALDASPIQQYGTEMERSKRSVRSYGKFEGAVDSQASLNDGLPVRRKMFLRLFPGAASPKVWAVNRSGAPLTTGGVVEVSGTHWGRWK